MKRNLFPLLFNISIAMESNNPLDNNNKVTNKLNLTLKEIFNPIVAMEPSNAFGKNYKVTNELNLTLKEIENSNMTFMMKFSLTSFIELKIEANNQKTGTYYLNGGECEIIVIKMQEDKYHIKINSVR